MISVDKITDSIPRASVEQVLEVLAFVASSNGKSTFDQIRVFLARRSKRLAPASRTFMWTVARDVLSDLQRLSLVETGILPRKQSIAHRYAETPAQATDSGLRLASLYRESPGRAFDSLLILWLSKHSYFRLLLAKLRVNPLFVPDVTSFAQTGINLTKMENPETIASRLSENCFQRLAIAKFNGDKARVLSQSIHERVQQVSKTLAMTAIDAKQWVDNMQDRVVIPSLLAAESLPFDTVTFQHLLKAGKDFLAASWTTSHPDYPLRVIFSTCEFRPSLDTDSEVVEVHHHGKSFASERFKSSLLGAYRRLANQSASYVNAYAVRAMVCLDLQIQSQVFAACLKDLLNESRSDLTIYTELPFDPPPQGEDYLQLDQNRIGLLKLTSTNGA
jgi:hypothetical protein